MGLTEPAKCRAEKFATFCLNENFGSRVDIDKLLRARQASCELLPELLNITVIYWPSEVRASGVGLLTDS